MPYSQSSIPIIDFEPFLQGSDRQQQAVVEQINYACREIGFFYLTRCGIKDCLLDQLFAQTQRLFQLPLNVKQQLAWTDAQSNQGYISIARERLDPNQPGDLKEAFNIGDINSLAIASKWSDGQQFEQTIAAFYSACVSALDGILRAIARSLNLPDDFLTVRHDRQEHTLRLLHYPPLVHSPLPGQIRAGAHSDYGSLTLLFQDAIGGLEVQTAAGEWLAATPVPGAVLINLGDLMERWTNHRFRSTKHRVIVPANASAQHRYSIAFFCHPNSEVEVACLETCQSESDPPLYPPISASDYLISRLRATY